MGGGISLLGFSIVPTVSCSTSNSNDLNVSKPDNNVSRPDNNISRPDIKEHYLDWYSKITTSDWNRDNEGNIINAYCSSESQALDLYLNNWGHFYNIDLHQKREPKNYIENSFLISNSFKNRKNWNLETRGQDYQYISQALAKANSPDFSFEVYHGVEFMETEFYDQLRDSIDLEGNGFYNYSRCIGKTIESYGFISTTFNKSWAIRFSGGNNWLNNDILQRPLKEDVMFKINIPPKTPKVAYVSNFAFNGDYNSEEQVLIDKNCKFKIKNVYKEQNVNVFDVDLLW